MTISVTQITSDVLGQRAPPFTRITQLDAEVVTSGQQATKITSLHARVLGDNPPNSTPVRVTQQFMLALCTITPNFKWVEMFTTEVFPKDISFNSIGATRFTTDVVIVDSGDDQRNARWDQPLMEYDVAYGVRTMEDLHALISFFRAMKGRLNGFLYDDYIDNTSTLAVLTDARAAPATTPVDQLIGAGDGGTKVFQLVKTYAAFGGFSQIRPIQKPKDGTVKIAINNIPVFNFTVDLATGLVTFVSNLVATPTAAMTLAASGTSLTISGPAGTFLGFVNGDRVVTAGWSNPLNNFSENDQVNVNGYNPDGSSITINVPLGKGANEAGRIGVVFYRHPAPVSGVNITAGYGFYVPVRFDTDRLPVSLEEYGIGGANDVKLIELRPQDATP